MRKALQRIPSVYAVSSPFLFQYIAMSDINSLLAMRRSPYTDITGISDLYDVFPFAIVEELNEPMVLNTSLSVTISTELFAAANSQKVWSIESSISRKDNLDELINEASETIVRRRRKDKLIRN